MLERRREFAKDTRLMSFQQHHKDIKVGQQRERERTAELAANHSSRFERILIKTLLKEEPQEGSMSAFEHGDR